MKDVKIPDNAPKELFLKRHADFIAAYGQKKDDYVSKMLNVVSKVMIHVPVSTKMLGDLRGGVGGEFPRNGPGHVGSCGPCVT